ncbi:MAG: hypothetical protein ACI845_000518 [Gammaproteobacteria bacterium]
MLIILALVAGSELWTQYHLSQWREPVVVNLFAINADRDSASERYLQHLPIRNFRSIKLFLNREASHYSIRAPAFAIRYRGMVSALPPQLPERGGVFDNILWSLKFRGWSLYHRWKTSVAVADVNLYILYYNTRTNQRLRHSVGLKQGTIGQINAFAENRYQGSNNVVIAHELLHTLGASDQYDQNNLPIYPSGYAAPYQKPLHPQSKAEIMGGRIPRNPGQADIPTSLKGGVNRALYGC